MSTATRPAVPETPSKKVAASFAEIDVNATPSKPKGVDADDFAEPPFLSKGKPVVVEKKADEPQHAADALHGKFVGEVDLPEEEEPLLVESSRRFVLFPIRYHEVSHGYKAWHLTNSTDIVRLTMLH